MKRYIFIFTVIACLGSTGLFAQNRSIQFIEKPWTEILETAKKENKLIFMDAYAVWCGPCKWMSANIFTNDSIADFFNGNFICTKFDMEKGEGLTLRQLYQVKAYPTLLFINGDGELVHAKVGAARAIPEYLELGQVAMDPDERLGAYIKRYQAGQLSGNSWLTYFRRLSEAYIPYKDQLRTYFNSQPESELINRTNWSLIFHFSDDLNSKEFKYLVRNAEQYASLYSSDSVNAKIHDVLLRSLTNFQRNPAFTEEKYEAIKKDIRGCGVSSQSADRVIFEAEIQRYRSRGDVDGLYTLGVADLDRAFGDNADMYNMMAWLIFSMTSEVKYLEQAEKWAQKSVSLNSQAFNNDTWANILFKLKRYDEAVKAGEKALELAKLQNLPVANYEVNLIKYKSVTPGQ